MQSIGCARTAPQVWLAMMAITAMLLIAIAVTSAGSTSGLAEPPEPMGGHSTCIAEAVSGPCS
jgi:hypothetical protein